MEYIRRTYGVPAKRGMEVIALGKPGVIVGSNGAYLRIKTETSTGYIILTFHPTFEIVYLNEKKKGES